MLYLHFSIIGCPTNSQRYDGVLLGIGAQQAIQWIRSQIPLFKFHVCSMLCRCRRGVLGNGVESSNPWSRRTDMQPDRSSRDSYCIIKSSLMELRRKRFVHVILDCAFFFFFCVLLVISRPHGTRNTKIISQNLGEN